MLIYFGRVNRLLNDPMHNNDCPTREDGIPISVFMHNYERGRGSFLNVNASRVTERNVLRTLFLKPTYLLLLLD